MVVQDKPRLTCLPQPLPRIHQTTTAVTCHAGLPPILNLYFSSPPFSPLVPHNIDPPFPHSPTMSLKTAVLEPRMMQKPPFTAEVAGSSPVPGETIPRRTIRHVDKLLSEPEEGVHTIFDLVKISVERFGTLKAVASRKLIRKHNEVKKVKKVVDGQVQEVDKKWTYFEMSGYTYTSFKEYETLMLQLGAGLRKLGLKPQDRLHLYAATR